MARSGASTGMSAAKGRMTASAELSAPTSVWPRARRSPLAACADSRGRIAVASDTVMTECGTITIRNAVE